ncbi:MAG: molybdopterin-dependent oxidoreductase [Hyphomicrobiales bacterium]|nr:molybdopterin-dependent oxidoreductase [Hyphomicrobiales bacterium]
MKTYCLMCSVRCPVECHVENGRLVEVVPDCEHPLGGVSCIKASAAPEFVADPQRLRYPMKRTNPKTASDPGWERLSWEEALTTVAQNLQEARETHGAESIVFYRPAPGGSGASDYHLWLMRLAHAFGSPNIAMTTHVCNWHRDSGSAFTYGVGMPQPEYEHAGCVLVWGTNPHNTHVRHARDIDAAVERGAKLVVIDPRRIPLAGHADSWLRVQPGSDLPLALGLINRLIEKRYYDEAFLSKWTNAPFLIREDSGSLLTGADLGVSGADAPRYVARDASSGELAIYDPARVSYESDSVTPELDCQTSVALPGGGSVACRTGFSALREIASPFTLEHTSQVTSIPESEIARAADLLGTAGPVCYYTWNGLEQHADAMQTNRAACILFALTGDFDRRGGMVLYPHVPMKMMAGMKLLPTEASQKRLGASQRPLGPAGGPGWAGAGAVQAYDLYEAITEQSPYPVKALVSFGGNLICSNPDTRRGAEALKKLDFYAHLDCYENPTARFADILLPAASAWESELVGKMDWRDRGHVQVRRAVVTPQYERRSDLDVMFDLAVRLGLGDAFFQGSMEAGLNEMLSPLGKTMAELRQESNGISIALDPTYKKYEQHLPETGCRKGFNTPSRLLEIYSLTLAKHGYDPLPRYEEPRERAAADRTEYPLLLTSGKSAAFTHGSYRSIPRLRREVPEPILYMHPDAARQRHITDGEWAALCTPVGSIKLRAKLDEYLDPEVVAGEEGWWQECQELDLPGYNPLSSDGGNLNLIIDDNLIDPLSGSSPLRGQPCEVRKLNS